MKRMHKTRPVKILFLVSGLFCLALTGCSQISDFFSRPSMPTADDENHPAAAREDVPGDAQPKTMGSMLGGFLSFPDTGDK